jgi:glycosyltransferase involved in cell wall biosynthesis
VVIPVCNEKATIDEILRRVIETEFRKEIVLVDDCSTDGTPPDPQKKWPSCNPRRKTSSRLRRARFGDAVKSTGSLGLALSLLRPVSFPNLPSFIPIPNVLRRQFP